MLFLYEFYALQQKGQVCPNCLLIQESNSPIVTSEQDGLILYNYECQHCFCEYFKEGPKRKYDAVDTIEYIQRMEMESMNSKHSKNKKNKIF